LTMTATVCARNGVPQQAMMIAAAMIAKETLKLVAVIFSSAVSADLNVVRPQPRDRCACGLIQLLDLSAAAGGRSVAKRSQAKLEHEGMAENGRGGSCGDVGRRVIIGCHVI
jgi:hypothetical protein